MKGNFEAHSSDQCDRQERVMLAAAVALVRVLYTVRPTLLETLALQEQTAVPGDHSPALETSLPTCGSKFWFHVCCLQTVSPQRQVAMDMISFTTTTNVSMTLATTSM